jgi:prepilin-type N-terminal cleavage/methylation domain-containing protein
MSMTSQRRGFTIVELLVVVAIIALLIGILLPAIGKAREQALVSQSESNLRQIATAHGSYAGAWNDRQPTYIPDDFSVYGDNYAQALANYQQTNGQLIPIAVIGYERNFVWIWNYAPNATSGTARGYLPLDFSASGGSWFGNFRIPNNRAFSTHLNGRFYDPVFYAPRDRVVMEVALRAFEYPGEFDPFTQGVTSTQAIWASYCLSPAAMMSPDVLRNHNGSYFRNPWFLPGGWRSPSYGMALYPTLKTHMLEHHWLQNMNKECSPFWDGGTYENCEPFYFNHSIVSSPVTLFYDGHIELVGTMTADNAHKRLLAQAGHGLWSKDTTLGGAYTPDFVGANGGYFSGFAEDWTNTSFHILTIEGIRGRDLVSD